MKKNMTDIERLARKIFDAVEWDLRFRNGISSEWGKIEKKIQKEIRETNEKLIVDVLVKFLSPRKEKSDPSKHTIL